MGTCLALTALPAAPGWAGSAAGPTAEGMPSWNGAALPVALGLLSLLLLLALWRSQAAARRDRRARQVAEARAQTLFDAAPVGVIIIDPVSHAILDANDRACRELGYQRSELLRLSIRDVDALGDSAQLRARGKAHTIGPEMQEFEAQHRTKEGALRDVLVRVKGIQLDGRDVTYGASFDITDRKRAEEERRLLLAEIDHRARNLLSVVQATLRLVPRDDAASYARAVEDRVLALGRAHTLLARGRWRGTALRSLVESELGTLLNLRDGAEPRLKAEGPDVTLVATATQSLSMVLHELSTNAAKHGALLRPEGRVQVSWSVMPDGGLRLCWTESGGPTVLAPPRHRGFGSRLVELTVQRQLQGRLRHSWRPGGLACEILLPKEVLSAPSAEGQGVVPGTASGARPSLEGVVDPLAPPRRPSRPAA